MDNKEKVEALCGVIEQLLDLIQDETAAQCIYEECIGICDTPEYEREGWE